jgi:hypothetical protein
VARRRGRAHSRRPGPGSGTSISQPGAYQRHWQAGADALPSACHTGHWQAAGRAWAEGERQRPGPGPPGGAPTSASWWSTPSRPEQSVDRGLRRTRRARSASDSELGRRTLLPVCFLIRLFAENFASPCERTTLYMSPGAFNFNSHGSKATAASTQKHAKYCCTCNHPIQSAAVRTGLTTKASQVPRDTRTDSSQSELAPQNETLFNPDD